MTKNNIKELSIQVDLNGLSFCILNRTLNEIEFLKSVEFESRLSPFDILSRLKTELSSNPIFSQDFKEVLVIHQNEIASLVPESLYDKHYKVDYLKFNSKILKTDFIATDQLEVNKSINVYVPYVNINNFIFDTFGSFTYKHASSILIDAILQNADSTYDKPKLLVNVNRSTIEVLVYKANELQLFNVFDYSSKEDFIYYILFVFEQLQLDVEVTIVELSGNIEKDDELFHVLYTYVRHVNIIETKYSFDFSEALKKVPYHKNFIILNSF
ncbi:DUF3822 family protein [Winogradskyella alexanderae]|uniref:DUF3822 family protein n=1 Tax=Winogradskyella alexanderae TaxID=2877123 RepID=A0ABS7XTT3_9FLAO|nr:DUF3822 family protein [Winogradskyella alexanderae]MCA0133441.1 DUF3822 family protein [Winogradskyella alexanderae]